MHAARWMTQEAAFRAPGTALPDSETRGLATNVAARVGAQYTCMNVLEQKLKCTHTT
jgi:hypothetical protein